MMKNSNLAMSKANSILSVKVDRLMEKAIEVVDWAMQMTQQSTVQRQAFLTGSQKNIDDIKARNAVLDGEIKTKKDNLLQLETTVDATTQLVTLKENLTKEIENAQKEIAVNEERIKSLNQQVKTYQAKAPVDDKNMMLTEQFVKPLLRALANIKDANIITINGDGVVQSTAQLKMQ
jgi:predicted RNase H-like nuclease (RuvC/YqgF family)